MADRGARTRRAAAGPEAPDARAPLGKLAQLAPSQLFLANWRAIDATREPAGDRYDVEPVLTLGFAALCLTFMEYASQSRVLGALLDLFDGDVLEELSYVARLREADFWDLAKLGHWCGVHVLGYLVFPALFLAARGKRLRDYYFGVKGIGAHLWLYGLAYLIVLGCVVGVSFRSDFSRYYPFYDQAQRSWLDLGVWELMYAAQFFALEFFFRGFLLESLRRPLGSHAIFVSAVPYVMIHFGKPVGETVVALIAGIFLGTLAMRTRSLWLGVLIHVSVAISMDVAALLQSGRGLPSAMLPPGLGS